jgi:hypothetical protein
MGFMVVRLKSAGNYAFSGTVDDGILIQKDTVHTLNAVSLFGILILSSYVRQLQPITLYY